MSGMRGGTEPAEVGRSSWRTAVIRNFWLSAALVIAGLLCGLVIVTSPDWRVAAAIRRCDRIEFYQCFDSGTANITVTGAECRSVMDDVGFTYFRHWSRYAWMGVPTRSMTFSAQSRNLLRLGIIDDATCQQAAFPYWGDLCLSARGRAMIEHYTRALAAMEPALIADRRRFSGAWSSEDGLHLQIDVDKNAVTMRGARGPGILDGLVSTSCSLDSGVGGTLSAACLLPIPGVDLLHPVLVLQRVPQGMRMEFTNWPSADARVAAAVLPCFAQTAVPSGDYEVITVMLHAQAPQ
jgi:hypothetical protein